VTTEVGPMFQTVDAAGRLRMPAGYENATVAVRVLSTGEVFIRRAADEAGETPGEPALPPLSDRDRDLLLGWIENPPEPNEALRAAAARFRQHYG
jgi:hypothetical protein